MKTLAIKLEDGTHAQLTAIAQLEDQPVTLLIKQAVEGFIESKRNQPELTARAADALDEIERDAATRREAITTLLGPKPTAAPESGEEPTSTRRTRGRSEETPTS